MIIRLWSIWAILAMLEAYFLWQDPSLCIPVLIAWTGGVISAQILETRRRDAGDRRIEVGRGR